MCKLDIKKDICKLKLQPVVAGRYSDSFSELFIKIRNADETTINSYFLDLVFRLPQKITCFVGSYLIEIFYKSGTTVFLEIPAESKRTHICYTAYFF
jgi:hypothetical protein